MSRWDPYCDNGGTVAAISGPDFAIVGADTRMSQGFFILSRNAAKVTQLGPRMVIASAGMESDRAHLWRRLCARLEWYRFHNSDATPDVESVAQMLSNTLYYRRFFPILTFNILAGLDREGKGAVYGYDVVGSYQCSALHSNVMEPLLDAELKRRAFMGSTLTEGDAREVMLAAFRGAGERDIRTGDGVEVYTITQAGVRTESVPLKFD